ncbi:helicase HerA-like domain-containing protein [Legionella gresilensis]|uniref:helicase HerA-like domain-containing protein n=1 Tax=Legionella gresilensis TaxID=91823 RepID=UPI001040E706|nr:helicase HerA-like domain-containing protein [Legionella gresilensis]
MNKSSTSELSVPYQARPTFSFSLGNILIDNKIVPNASVNLLFKNFNRHGLIAGATGTGKTKTMQVLCEQLSQAGIPSLVMDIKGDVSGLAMPAIPNDFLKSLSQLLNISFIPKAYPVELFTLSEKLTGVQLRTTLIDFGALLFARLLELNETQASIITVIFEYAKVNNLPLITLNDFKAILNFIQTEEGKADFKAQFGNVASTSINIILRKIIDLETQGIKEFFSKPAFKINDLLRINAQGEGIISILRLMTMQENPKLFSTFMIKLLTDVYQKLPEIGDPPKPKLVLFIDEAHLIFNQASQTLLQLLETTVKLIRSKGVGIIFCTQTPSDIPASILSQLGLKIQHSLRAFTAKDRQAIKLVAQNFPPSNYYNIENLLTSLGIGEALVTALDDRGQPTPVVHCMMRPPESRMGSLTNQEANSIIMKSELLAYYSQIITEKSAAEVLANKRHPEPGKINKNNQEKDELSIITTLGKSSLFRQIVRQTFRELTRALLRAMGLKK